MKVGILGTGDVGQTLGRGFIALGHSVRLGSRDAANPKAVAWAKSAGPKASAGTFADAAEFGETVVLATLGIATGNAIRMADVSRFSGKVVLDVTNPLDTSQGMPPRLIGGVGDSAGENNQKLLADAHVVKVFNTVGSHLMFRPELPGAPPSMFICGDHDPSKKKVSEICRDFGWETLDVGAISSSHYLEAMCMVWVLTALKTENWNQAFKMLRK